MKFDFKRFFGKIRVNFNSSLEYLQTSGKTLVATVVVSIILMAAICVLVFFAAVQGPEEVLIPDVTGKYLEEADKIRFNAFANSVNSNSKDFNVITFNYTNTLEKLLAIDTKDSRVEKSFGSNRILHNIIHVHGSLEEAIIVGVDNETQIANEILKKNDNIRDLFIKIESNRAMKNLRHDNCEGFIKNAHLIILFGVSLGNTDLRWWTLIGQELKRRNNLAIIQHIYRPNAVLPTRKQLLARIERQHQKELLQKMGIKQDEQSKGIVERFFFTVNANIFKK